MLTKSTLKIDNDYIDRDEAEAFIQQKPVKSIFSILRPGIGVYYWAEKKPTKFRKKVSEIFGKQPVFFDSILSDNAMKKLKMYLQNKGFYHAIVSRKIKHTKHTVQVNYSIVCGNPYLIRDVSYSIADSLISDLLLKDKKDTYIRSGSIFDTYMLDDVRDRIQKKLRQNGYYSFAKSEITYLVDTSRNQADVTLKIPLAKVASTENSDSILQIPHPRYTLHTIYIEPETNIENDSTVKFDTLSFHYKLHRNDSISHSFYYIRRNQKSINPHVLAGAMLFHDGELYNQDAVNLTYKRFIGMPVFRSVSFNFAPFNPDQILKGDKPLLDCHVRLSPNPRNVMSLGTEGTNSGGQLGMGFNTIYNNRNFFSGAELFHFKINIAAEVQSNIPSASNKFLVFNTFSSSFDAGIDLPWIFNPFASRGVIKSTSGRTSTNIGYGFENRPDYRRNVTTLSYLYQWGKRDNVKNILVPFELNYVSILKDASFADYLNSRSDPQYVSQYTNHFISLVRYSLIISNQLLPKDRNFHLWRFNIETAGNIPYVLDKLIHKEPGSIGYFTRLGVRYSQYIRVDAEYRKYWAVATQSTLALRAGGGLGIPYGNANSLPFEKGFYLGGSNDMRGWELRSLGPGSYQSPTVSYDRTGEIMFITNLEYRFPIYSYLKGVFFADAGNIWLRQDNTSFPGGKFYLDKALNSLALDAGTGFRFDFSFFVFRVDLAWKVKQPSLTEKWNTPGKLGFRNAVWNFGIGYPF